MIGPPHQPQLDAADLRAFTADSTCGAAPAPGPPACEAFGSDAGWGLGARTLGEDRRDAFRRLLMPARVRVNVPVDVTPMRHDGTMVLDAPGVIADDLEVFGCPAGDSVGEQDLAVTSGVAERMPGSSTGVAPHASAGSAIVNGEVDDAHLRPVLRQCRCLRGELGLDGLTVE